jgi:hypothetical protein
MSSLEGKTRHEGRLRPILWLRTRDCGSEHQIHLNTRLERSDRPGFSRPATLSHARDRYSEDKQRVLRN